MSARDLVAEALVELEGLTPQVPAPDWTAASCAQSDPDAWFPEVGGSNSYARKICRACPIRSECLAWAVATGQRFGMWGALSEHQLAQLRRRLRVEGVAAGV